ncbi:bifunctional precorrin-2 dehydrogenase/sirohydrochlorin ferrochelatase [Eubacterium sp. TM05-53]|jgi:precorrin-2 dehydrogenase/sirohydrochlorin ferrochelatase|nr:bifunctional precorrin-2 dehydrogenase/sirohydrochlorin ferrochelatase [Eubacterium sp. TM05-53]CDL65517.1 unnamed protein product [uncultured bacterium]
MAYFPFFIDITDCKALVVGSGPIAQNKIKILKEFGAKVTVLSKQENSDVTKEFEIEDLDGFNIVVAATNDSQLNHKISLECKKRNILVNAVDQKEDCTFIFPSYIKQKDVVAAFSSSGKNPVLCQYLKKENESIVTRQLGEINDRMEMIRKELKSVDGQTRKEILKEFLYNQLEK